MSAVEHTDRGHGGARENKTREIKAREIKVWDPLVRLIHWSVALAVLVNSFSDAERPLHEWVGYIALGLVVLRLIWGLIGARPARFASFPPNPMAAVHHLGQMLRGDRGAHLSHNPLGALMVYNLWITIALLALTGYMMGTMRFFGLEWVEEAHELIYGWLLASVGLHVAGVVLDQMRTGVGLVRAMITGRKRVPEGVTLK